MPNPYNSADRAEYERIFCTSAALLFADILPADPRARAKHAEFLDRLRANPSQAYFNQAMKELPNDPEAVATGLTPELVRRVYAQPLRRAGEQATRLLAAAQAMQQSYLSAPHPVKLQPFAPQTPQMVQDWLREHYPNGGAAGEGISMGGYGIARAENGKVSTDFLATDFLMDCVAVVLVARPPEGGKIISLLTHIDANADTKMQIPKLLANFPPGYRIEATVLGSNINDHPYMNVDILEALEQSGRVSSIRYNFNGPNTVAVHTATGQVLTASAPDEWEHRSQIGPELPVKIDFASRDNSASFRALQWNNLRTSDKPVAGGFPLLRQVDPVLLPDADGPKAMLKALTADGTLSPDDLAAVVTETARQLRHNNVRYEVQGDSVVLQIDGANVIGFGMPGVRLAARQASGVENAAR